MTADAYLDRVAAMRAASWVGAALAGVASAGFGLAVYALRLRRRNERLTTRALIDSESRFRTLVEAADVVVWEYDAGADRFTYVSPQVRRFGYPLESWLVAGAWRDRLHPDDRERVVAECAAYVREGRAHRLQYRMIDARGDIVWIDDFASAPSNQDGQVLLRGVLVDVTERVRAAQRQEAALELATRLASASTVRDAARVINDALIRTTGVERSAVLLYDDANVCRFVGWRGLSVRYREAVEGHCPWARGTSSAAPIVVNDLSCDSSLQSYRELFDAERIRSLAFIPLVTEDGVIGKLMLYSDQLDFFTPSRISAASEAAAYLGVVTGRLHAQGCLARAKEAAEAATRAKSEFLANMSHEIRTPMAAILGYSALLIEDESEPDAQERRREHVGVIQRNGEYLLALINDILDISKIEAGKMHVEVHASDPVSVAAEVISLMSQKATEKGLSLRMVSDSPLPAAVETDALRLRQILVNLVGNAIKFTEEGEVVVTIAYRPRDDHHGTLTYSVRDTGIGLAPEVIGRLFNAFEQADASMSRRFGGTGLGLRICKRLSALLGGDVTVESELGVGSTFTLQLDVRTASNAVAPAGSDRAHAVYAESPSPRTPAELPLRGVRVLLAEDGPDNRRLIAHVLRKVGATVTVVENGRDLVGALVDAGGACHDERFDLIISDMQMPELDGYSAVRLLRERGSRLPVVALTAHAMSGDEERCLDAGCDAYATKPIDRRALVAACERAQSARRDADLRCAA